MTSLRCGAPALEVWNPRPRPRPRRKRVLRIAYRVWRMTSSDSPCPLSHSARPSPCFRPVSWSLIPPLPPDPRRAFAEQLLHAVALHQRAHQGTLAPERVAQPDVVLQPQFQRIHAQLFGQLIHQRFDRKSDLRVAEALHGAGRRLVGVDGHAVVAHRPELVERGQPARGHAQVGIALDDVRADVGDQFLVRAQQRAVVFGGDLQADDGGILGVIVHVLFPRQRQLHRPPRLQRQRHADGDGRVHLDRGAEGAADGDADHVHLAQGDPEDRAQDDAHVVDGLRGRPDRDAAVRLGPAHDSLGFHLGVVDLRRAELALDHDIGCGERGFDVPFEDVARTGDVVFDRDFVVAQHHRVVERRGAGLHRRDGIGDHGQRLVLHHHRPRRLLGQRLGLGRHRRHRLAHAPHLVGQDVVIFVQRPRHRDDALVVADLGHVSEGEAYGAHRFRGAGVHAHDARVRVRAGHDPPVQHPRQTDIGCVLLLPRDACDPVLAPGGVPDDIELSLTHGVPPSLSLNVRR